MNNQMKLPNNKKGKFKMKKMNFKENKDPLNSIESIMYKRKIVLKIYKENHNNNNHHRHFLFNLN